MEETEALRRFELARVARLATADSKGHPHLVPLVFAIWSGSVYSAVDHKPKASVRLKRLANIDANPYVSLLADEYDDDWSQLWWVRIDGAARIIETGDTWERAIELLADKYAQYRGHPPTGIVISISIDRISGWSASG